MQSKQIISGITIAAALALTGTACSSSGTAGAANGNRNANAQGLTLLAKMTAPQAVSQSTKAIASKQSAKMHMTVKSPVINETADGSVAFGADPKMVTTLTMDSSDPQAGPMFKQLGKMEMRLVGGVGYLNMGAHSSQIRDAMQGKHWMKIDFAELDQVPSLASFSFMKDMIKNDDPSSKLDSLLASPDLKQVGTEQRGGVQALHYSGTVSADDMLKATAAGSGISQQDLDSAKALMQQAGVTKVDYDLWIDGDGLPVEIKFSEDTNAGAVSGDITYSDWGVPVSVSAPDAGDTADIVQLMNSQQ